MITGIDLFAGGGGTTTGAKEAGVRMLWAANHNPIAVETHAANHPEVHHETQDLQQAAWELVPKHDIAFASPCCQHHSKAVGKKQYNVKADLSRSTAWSVVSCAEYHRPPVLVIENVRCFTNWILYDTWKLALEKLGYTVSVNIVNAKDMGIPQNRERLFIICTKTKSPFVLDIEPQEYRSARSIIDLSMDGYNWDYVENRAANTQRRVAHGRKRFGEIFLEAAYSGEDGGRSIDKVLGCVTTVNKHYLVMGNKIRPLSIKELAAAQSFDDDYIWPKGAVATKSLIGNAIPPKMAEMVTKSIIGAI